MSDMPDYTHAIYTSVKNTWQDAENLDGSHGYTTYIWIPEETYQVDLMKLHIYSEQFRAFSTGAAAGGAAVKTSSGGGVHNHTVTGATSSAVTPSHTHQVIIGEKTSAGSGGAHRHKIFDYFGDTVGDPRLRVFYGTKSDSDPVGVVFTIAENVDLYSWTYNDAHTHIIDIATPTSESGGGNHSHTVSGQTTSEQANHTHTVTLTNHTHDIVYGIYEEDITGRTLSAILYDPDGNVLENFGVILTGEDSDIIDLTDHFETLEYGMYKMVLSASGRLRARLVFYELCKMYAQY